MGLTSFLLASCVLVADVPDRPNVLIFYADDLGYGDIGVNGRMVFKTPTSIAWRAMVDSSRASTSPSPCARHRGRLC